MALTRLRTGGIAANAVVAASIAPGAVDIVDIADNAITSAKLAANAVTTVKIAANAVTAPQIAPGAIPPSIPTGTIATFAGDPGEGWLEANGQIVSQVTYSDLYSKVGLIVDGMRTTTATYVLYPGANGTGSGTAFFSYVAYGNGTYVAGVRNDSLAYERHYTSTDGITWTARSFGWVAGMNVMGKVIYTDKFIATFEVSSTAETNRNSIATSTDGITWTVRTYTNISSPRDIVYSGSIYVATDDISTINGISTSTDGITWTARTAAAPPFVGYLAYGNNTFVLASLGVTFGTYKPIIQTSTDGITWTVRSVPMVAPSYRGGITFDGDKFWLASNQQRAAQCSVYQTSTDGITWTIDTVLPTLLPTCRSMGYDSTNDILMAYGYSANGVGNTGQRILFSKDKGVTWHVDSFSAATAAPTTTSGLIATSERIETTAPFSIGGVNGKIFLGGYSTAYLASASTGEIGFLYVRDPYTFQTDTQFALPNSGTQAGLTAAYGGINTSVSSMFANGLNLKNYIKT